MRSRAGIAPIHRNRRRRRIAITRWSSYPRFMIAQTAAFLTATERERGCRTAILVLSVPRLIRSPNCQRGERFAVSASALPTSAAIRRQMFARRHYENEEPTYLALLLSCSFALAAAASADPINVRRDDHPSALSARGIATADFNRDGWLDIATAHHDPDGVTILLNRGKAGGYTQRFFALLDGPFDIAAADIDKDGIPDLAIATADSNAINIWYGNSNGAFLRSRWPWRALPIRAGSRLRISIATAISTCTTAAISPRSIAALPRASSAARSASPTRAAAARHLRPGSLSARGCGASTRRRARPR